MPFISAGDGDLKSAFITDAWLIDQFVGNRLWSWGYNFYGQLGDNTQTSRSTPVQTVTGGTNWQFINTGYPAAIKTDGTLWVWGRGDSGQLGDNTSNNRSSPVQTVTGGTNWKQVSAGYAAKAAIKTDGTLWGWGRNDSGQLGNNGGGLISSPIQTITGGTNWKQVACGAYWFTAAIKTDGTLWLWGQNFYGQLGDNTRIDKSSPVQTITGGTNWNQVACGYRHTAAIKTDGTLWLWGQNFYGQLGDNTRSSRSSPVQTIAGGTNWKQVSAGRAATAAIKTDGTLWIWGGNSYGELGDNTISNKSSPVQTVSGGNSWKQVSYYYQHMAAIKTDGTLWTWGRNYYGQLGDNTQTDRSSPVQTVTGGANWKQVSTGYYGTAAVTYGD